MTTLTALETTVLHALALNAEDVSGGDFAILDEVTVPGLNRQQLGALVTTLATKGVIGVYPEVVNGVPLTQITIHDERS